MSAARARSGGASRARSRVIVLVCLLVHLLVAGLSSAHAAQRSLARIEAARALVHVAEHRAVARAADARRPEGRRQASAPPVLARAVDTFVPACPYRDERPIDRSKRFEPPRIPRDVVARGPPPAA